MLLKKMCFDGGVVVVVVVNALTALASQWTILVARKTGTRLRQSQGKLPAEILIAAILQAEVCLEV